MPQHSVDEKGRKTQGGTAVAGASNRVTLIAVGLLLVVVVMVAKAGRGGEEETDSSLPAASESSGETEAPPVATPTTGTSTDTGTVGFTGFDAGPVSDGKAITLKSMEEELGKRKFWSTVTADEESNTIITVTSSSCEDPVLKRVLKNTGPQLLSSGFVAVRCVAKHGAMIFEIKL